LPIAESVGTTTDVTTDDLTDNFAGLTEEEGPSSQDEINLETEETININETDGEEA
jgi:hypothetical protein